MTDKKLKKPTKKPRKSAYDYHEVIHFVEEKYGFDSRDYAGKYSSKPFDETIPYLDFWHWLIDGPFAELHNRSAKYLDLKFELEDEETPTWVKEILQKIFDEFQEDEMEFWVEW